MSIKLRNYSYRRRAKEEKAVGILSNLQESWSNWNSRIELDSIWMPDDPDRGTRSILKIKVKTWEVSCKWKNVLGNLHNSQSSRAQSSFELKLRIHVCWCMSRPNIYMCIYVYVGMKYAKHISLSRSKNITTWGKPQSEAQAKVLRKWQTKTNQLCLPSSSFFVCPATWIWYVTIKTSTETTVGSAWS